MTINLKEIRVFDTDNIKLDKINYNFDQLIVNGGGPKGYNGPNGNVGPQGFQGVQGYQGPRGFQGVQGPSASSATTNWDAVAQNLTSATIAATLFSKHPDAADISSSYAAAIPLFPAVVGAGYVLGDNGYQGQQSNTSGLPKYQWVVNRRRDKVSSNIRFTSSDVIGNAFDITMDNYNPVLASTTYRLNLGFIENNLKNTQLNLRSKEHIIASTSTGNYLLEVSTAGGEINVDSLFKSKVTFNQQLKISNLNVTTTAPQELPGPNKIVTAVDATGLVTYKTTDDLGGSVKIGTIISILPSIFSDAANFINAQTINTFANPNVPIQIRMGAGIGDYAGWYVCNGQEWKNGGPGTLVPDLNSYSFQIANNIISTDPNSQGTVNVTNDEIQILGGADIFIDANQVGTVSTQYNISTINGSGNNSLATNPSGSVFKVKKLPQIIYLGDTNLYWSQLGTDQLVTADFNSGDFNLGDFNAS